MLAVYIGLGILLYGGCVAGLRWEWKDIRAQRRIGEAAGQVEVDDLVSRAEHGLTTGDQEAEDQYLAVWRSLHGASARMALLAVTSDELALRCRARALEGKGPLRPVVEDAYCSELPADLGESAPRPGSPSAWQALDRALCHLSAVHASEDACAHADAHEQISIAARQLSDELALDGVETDLDHCIFCQSSPGDDVRVLYTARAAICEDCVQQIYSTLYDL